MTTFRWTCFVLNLIVAALDYWTWLKSGEERDLVAALAWTASTGAWLYQAVAG